jgi:hypothetical protein
MTANPVTPMRANSVIRSSSLTAEQWLDSALRT